MRYTSHLDLQRTWERWLRRASLPVYYSQGYTPRPKLQIGMALPLGFTAQRELLDLWLEEEIENSAMLAALRGSRPPGLRVIDVARVPLHDPTLQTQVQSAVYRAILPEGFDPQPEVSALLAAKHALRERRGKPYDLRPLIEKLESRRDDTGKENLYMRLSALEGATGRPDEVLLELGIDPDHARIERLEIIFAAGEGSPSVPQD